MAHARTLRLTSSLVLALLVATLCGVSVHRKVQTFQPLGFEPVIVEGGGGLAVGAVTDAGTGLVQGDLIMMVNGGEVGNPAAMAERLSQQGESELTLLRADQLQVIEYHRPPLAIDFSYLILALVGVGYLLIGLYMLLRQGGAQGMLFYLWCLASAAVYMLTRVPPLDPIFVALDLGDKLARIFLPALTLHLFLVFPSPLETGRLSRRLAPFLYLPAAALLALQLDLALANGRWIFGRPTVARLEALDRVDLLHLGVFALAALGILVYRMARSHGWEQQRQLQWVAFGLGGGYLPFLLLYVVPRVLEVRLPMPQVLTPLAVLPLALVPLTFAYAILRYKLWDIEIIVRDTISSTLTLLLGIIGFSLVNLAITRGVSQELVVARNLLSFVAGLAIAGLLVPTRRHLGSALERLQYRGTFGKRRALSAMGRELLHQRNLSQLCQVLVQDIQDGVSLQRAALYLCQKGELVPFSADDPELPRGLACDSLGEELWQEDYRRFSGVALPCEPMSAEQRLFVAGYRYAFPMTVRGRGVGLALAGYRQDQTPLNSEDLDLIRHLLDQASLAIENAQLMGQLHQQLEEVQRLQSYTEGIFESSPAGTAVLDRDGRLVSVNAAFAALAGRATRESLLGERLEDVLPLGTLPAPGEMPVQVSYMDGDATIGGGRRERFLQVSVADFERGRGLRILMVYDVTERVAMENALREKDRLAALGMLAAGVAHEVNTPITGISSYAQMLLAEIPETDPHHAILKKVERQTFRASRIVNNLLEFARNRQKDRQHVAVAPLVSECLDLLSDRLQKRQIRLEWAPPQEEILVLGCDGELQQVIANLVLNALDAMTETGGGTLGLEVEGDAATVRLRVRDTGPGIPPEKLETIFQPFYSTKLNRGGTGLGLSISHEIARRHGGDLRVESEPGRGACFILELPRAVPGARSLPQPA
ncbi:MAG TPA: ATP-binding protein [Thermoanaerobaculia bacterium]|nr:ATP-binding protein [Thermoanaerobaculia bacterium]